MLDNFDGKMFQEIFLDFVRVIIFFDISVLFGWFVFPPSAHQCVWSDGRYSLQHWRKITRTLLCSIFGLLAFYQSKLKHVQFNIIWVILTIPVYSWFIQNVILQFSVKHGFAQSIIATKLFAVEYKVGKLATLDIRLFEYTSQNTVCYTLSQPCKFAHYAFVQ